MSRDDEIIADLRLAQRLADDRPVPRAAWRGDLLRTLLDGALPPARPRRLRLLIAAYGLSGAVLLCLAALGI